MQRSKHQPLFYSDRHLFDKFLIENKRRIDSYFGSFVQKRFIRIDQMIDVFVHVTMFVKPLNARGHFVVHQSAMPLQININELAKLVPRMSSVRMSWPNVHDNQAHLDDMFPVRLLSTVATPISFQFTLD